MHFIKEGSNSQTKHKKDLTRPYQCIIKIKFKFHLVRPVEATTAEALLVS